MTVPRLSAYWRMTLSWFSGEYCWCSVDMRTYSAARIFSGPAKDDGRVDLVIPSIAATLCMSARSPFLGSPHTGGSLFAGSRWNIVGARLTCVRTPQRDSSQCQLKTMAALILSFLPSGHSAESDVPFEMRGTSSCILLGVSSLRLSPELRTERHGPASWDSAQIRAFLYNETQATFKEVFFSEPLP